MKDQDFNNLLQGVKEVGEMRRKIAQLHTKAICMCCL